MARTVKTIKDGNGNDLEVYADNCNVCNIEMTIEKKVADELENSFPFIKQKIQNGTPCTECSMEMKKNNINVFSSEDVEQIKIDLARHLAKKFSNNV